AGELRAHIVPLVARAASTSLEERRPEMMQSVVEVATRVCENVSEAREEVMRLRGTLSSLLAGAAPRLASAGTHPISHWADQEVTDSERYRLLLQEMQDVIRELLIFGLHVHVGIPDRD